MSLLKRRRQAAFHRRHNYQPGPVTADKWNDRLVRHIQPVGPRNFFAIWRSNVFVRHKTETLSRNYKVESRRRNTELKNDSVARWTARRPSLHAEPKQNDREKRNEPAVAVLIVDRPFSAQLPPKPEPKEGKKTTIAIVPNENRLTTGGVASGTFS